MTVQEIISYTRGLLKEHDSSKGPYTDKFLWETFNIAKADIMSNFRLRRFNYKNPINYVGFCMELEEGLSHECGCITQGCEVLVTKYEVPKYFSGRNTSSLRIFTLGNKEIDIVDEAEINDVLLYSKVHKDKMVATIVNKKIVIWNNLELKLIRVKALWEDVTAIDDVQYCSDNDTSQPDCIDVYNIDIGVDKDLVRRIILDGMFSLIGIPEQKQEDLNNDSNPEIKV